MMRNRLLLSGTWFVLIWMSMLAWLRRSCPMMWRKSFDGSELSMFSDRVYRGDLLHSFFHLFFASPFSSCRVADMLSGSSFRRNHVGRLALGLDPFSVASFASSSAISLPSMSSCPGVHINLTLQCRLSFQSFHPVVPSSILVLLLPSRYPGTVLPHFLASVTWRSSSASWILSSK